MRVKKWALAVLILSGFIVGCSSHDSEATAESSSKQSEASKVSTSSKSESKPLAIGQIYSTKKADPNIAYKMANKHVKFYRSLKEFGTGGGVYSYYQMEKGGIFGITQVITATRGIYYHVVEYTSGGFNQKGHADNLGYVKASDLKRFSTIKSKWHYARKRPYYVANPNSHRIWNSPVSTVHYAHVTHVLDRLTTVQLYATSELIKYNGQHYVYLETANGRKLGWVRKSKKTLIAGKYRNVARQLLKVKKGERLLSQKQAKQSTGNRIGVNDSLSLQQRAYVVKKGKQIVRVLIVGMDNRPTKITFSNGKAIKVVSYTYRRKAWKSTTNAKKLRTHFTADHEYLSVDSAKTYFYAKQSKKLVRVETDGYDGFASVTVYRNGHVSFATLIEKRVITYPYDDFK
ncbi:MULTISPECIES: hypothetical protein [Levilactobacillus]|uniref:hypothetical protein n=1 Tax=Levilactobacillus TaxID=2767886 RepID=UPI00194F8531|nr:hypothetical protein [Levilactobacillus sp. 244-2]